MIRHLRAAERIAKPWKNGGGTMWDIAVSPAGAGLDDFHWRLSMAEVASDGPFSNFPGIDRTIGILAGDGLVLEIDGRAPVTLTPASAPYAFPGDAATTGRRLGETVLDLNLMVRRAAAPASLSRHAITEARALETGPSILFWQSGEARIEADGKTFAPGPHDALHSDAPTHWLISPRGEARFWLVALG